MPTIPKTIRREQVFGPINRPLTDEELELERESLVTQTVEGEAISTKLLGMWVIHLTHIGKKYADPTQPMTLRDVDEIRRAWNHLERCLTADPDVAPMQRTHRKVLAEEMKKLTAAFDERVPR